MQSLEERLGQVRHLLLPVLTDLRLQDKMQLPRQPLALTELIATLANDSTVTLPSSQHPVIAVRQALPEPKAGSCLQRLIHLG